MKAILTIVAAIAFLAMFAFCEKCLPLSFVALVIWAVCCKIIENNYLTKEDEEEQV